jgi:DNA-binding transcriptional ArsR family regulator
MPEEPFLLVSLKEREAKELAQVISSNTCRKILDALSRKTMTESELSENLKLPLSTIHYNLQLLLKSKLVNADEFHYSEKGKEVMHYSLSNKYVIIAPKPATETFKDKLKKILPFFAIVLAAAALVQFFNKALVTTRTFGTKALYHVVTTPTLAKQAVDAVAEEAALPAMNAVAGGGRLAVPGPEVWAANATQNITITTNTTELLNTSQQIVREPLFSSTNIALWFLLGAIFAGIILWLIIWLTRKR